MELLGNVDDLVYALLASDLQEMKGRRSCRTIELSSDQSKYLLEEALDALRVETAIAHRIAELRQHRMGLHRNGRWGGGGAGGIFKFSGLPPSHPLRLLVPEAAGPAAPRACKGQAAE